MLLCILLYGYRCSTHVYRYTELVLRCSHSLVRVPPWRLPFRGGVRVRDKFCLQRHMTGVSEAHDRRTLTDFSASRLMDWPARWLISVQVGSFELVLQLLHSFRSAAVSSHISLAAVRRELFETCLSAAGR